MEVRKEGATRYPVTGYSNVLSSTVLFKVYNEYITLTSGECSGEWPHAQLNFLQLNFFNKIHGWFQCYVKHNGWESKVIGRLMLNVLMILTHLKTVLYTPRLSLDFKNYCILERNRNRKINKEIPMQWKSGREVQRYRLQWYSQAQY